MNIFAKFDENPAITLQVIKKTKRYGWMHARTDGRTDRRTDRQRENSIPHHKQSLRGVHGRTDNVKTVYPTTNKVCGGYKYAIHSLCHRWIFGLVWFDSLRPSQQLWSCRDGQFTQPHLQFNLETITLFIYT